MDLNFPRLVGNAQPAELPPDWTFLTVGMTARQAASPTAILAAQLMTVATIRPRFAPLDGSFNRAVAAALARWGEA